MSGVCSICGRQYSMFEQYEPHHCNRRITRDEIPLLVFAREMLKYWLDNPEHLFEDEFGWEIVEQVMLPTGMVEKVKYDPDEHGFIDCDPGDEICVWTDVAMKARD